MMKRPVKIKLSIHQSLVLSYFLTLKYQELMKDHRYPSVLQPLLLVETYERIQDKLLPNKLKEKNSFAFSLSKTMALRDFFEFYFQNGYLDDKTKEDPSVITAINMISTQLDKGFEKSSYKYMPAFDRTGSQIKLNDPGYLQKLEKMAPEACLIPEKFGLASQMNYL